MNWKAKRCVAVGLCLALVLSVSAAFADEDKDDDMDKHAKKRAEIDAMADDALKKLFDEDSGAKELYEKAVGYAVFNNLKIAFGFSGGGGSGVAVPKKGDRVYMKMGTGGIGLGLGGQRYQVVFLFQTEKVFKSFVDKGWQADASAQAAAGDAGANVGASFKNGVAVYQMTDKGLMASADITGTKYWKNDDLNEKDSAEEE